MSPLDSQDGKFSWHRSTSVDHTLAAVLELHLISQHHQLPKQNNLKELIQLSSLQLPRLLLLDFAQTAYLQRHIRDGKAEETAEPCLDPGRNLG